MNKKYLISDIKIIALSFLLMGNIFILPYPIRSILIGEKLAYINMLWFFGILLLLIKLKDKFVLRFMMGGGKVAIPLFFLLFVSYFLFGSFVSKVDMIRTFLVMCIPVLLTMFHFKKESDFKIFLKSTLIMISIPVYIVVVLGIFDLFLSRDISSFFLDLYKNFESLPKHYQMNRMISYFGHPLYASQMILIFGVLQGCWFKFYKNDKTPWGSYIITFIGLSLTSSKAAMLCFLFYLLFINLEVSKAKIIIGILSIMYGIYSLGFLDTLINRFLSDITTGNISSNRNSSLLNLMNNEYLQFKFLKGTSSAVPNDPIFLAALEYPPLHFAYTHGFFYVILLYIFLLVHPLVCFIKKKENLIFLSSAFLSIFIFINTNNGLSNGRDGMMLLAGVITIFINMADQQLEVKRG